MILMRSIAAQSELQTFLCKKTLVPNRSLATENSVIGTGAEREIVAVDPAGRRTRDIVSAESLLRILELHQSFSAREWSLRGGGGVQKSMSICRR
jgi:hypothetical protein